MTTTKRLARYETAQEMLGFLIASYTTQIHAERQNASVDPSKIEDLQAEKRRLGELEEGLTLKDPDGIEQVIETYGPKVRAMFASSKSVAVEGVTPVALGASA